MEQIPHGFDCMAIVEVARDMTTYVRLVICLSMNDDTLTSLTAHCLIASMSWLPYLVIRLIASVGVLSTNAPPLAASVILLSIGVSPS